MKILVTGATGFIGQVLVERLVAQGHGVRIFCRRSSQPAGRGDPRIEVAYGDVCAFRTVLQAMRGCRQVYHLAGYARNWSRDPSRYFDVNVRGTHNVLEAARRTKVSRVVLTSSSVSFGPSTGEPVREHDRGNLDFFTEYERSKYQAERLALTAVRRGQDVVIVNPSRVYGPGLLTESNAVTKMIQWYMQGKSRLILGNGRSVGNYVFIADVVAGHMQAMARGRTGESYLLGGENVSYNDFFRQLARVSGRHHWLLHLPAPIAFGFARFEKMRGQWLGQDPLITPDWVRTFLADWACSSAKAERELGYRFTPLAHGLGATLDWLRRGTAEKEVKTHEAAG